MFIDRFICFLPRNSLKKALAFMNSGDYQKACREFEAYLSKNPGNLLAKDQEMVRMYMVESYIEFAKHLEEEKRIEKAARQLEKAVELEPRYADVHFKLGSLYEEVGNRVNARESIKRALAINPRYFKARVMLSMSYWLDYKNARGIEELEESLSCSPNFFLDEVKKLIEYLKYDPENEEIKSIFHQLLEDRPSSSQVSKQIALEAIQNGDYDFAMSELRKSLSLHPDYPDLHNLLGIAYANKGMTDDAVMEFEMALKIHPGYLKAQLNMALALYEKGDMEKARKYLDHIIEIDPENELARNLMNEVNPVTNKR